MERSYLVTVAIPTRNRPEKLKHALRSCVAQHSPIFQYIAIDNASEPETALVCSQFAFDARFKYCRYDDHASINEQFSRCVRNANGKWIVIVGDDDALYPDFFSQLESLIQTNVDDIALISWELGQYRWPCFNQNEANRLSVAGVAPRRPDHQPTRAGCTADFIGHVHKSGLKSIYPSPGIYHRAIKLDLVHHLVAKHGWSNVFFHSPDISMQVHLVYSGFLYKHVFLPLTLSGYSANSTGSAFAGNDAVDVAKRYIAENPALVSDFFDLFPFFNRSLHDPVFSEVLGTWLVFVKTAQLYSCEPPALSLYIKSEINNARKLAPSLRVAMKQQLIQIAQVENIDIPSSLLAAFDENAPSSSLPGDSIDTYTLSAGKNNLSCQELFRYSFMRFSTDLSQVGISNAFDASIFAYVKFLTTPATS